MWNGVFYPYVQKHATGYSYGDYMYDSRGDRYYLLIVEVDKHEGSKDTRPHGGERDYTFLIREDNVPESDNYKFKNSTRGRIPWFDDYVIVNSPQEAIARFHGFGG